jgi:hypothetical protein
MSSLRLRQGGGLVLPVAGAGTGIVDARAAGGGEPTNNRAARVLRKAVLWRKKAFGCVSDRDCHFVERILTVVYMRRLQHRSAWEFLQQTLHVYRSGQPAAFLIIMGEPLPPFYNPGACGIIKHKHPTQGGKYDTITAPTVGCRSHRL